MSKVLQDGIINQEDKKQLAYQIITLDKCWQKKVLSVQDEAYNQLEDKELYIKLSEQEVAETLREFGIVVGTIVEGKLIGFHVSSFHDQETKDLGELIDLPIEKISQLAYIEATVVLPQFRGNGLQKKMIEKNIGLLKDIKEIKYLITTISEQNIPSLKSLMSLGFSVIATKEIGEGKMRNILYREITS